MSAVPTAKRRYEQCLPFAIDTENTIQAVEGRRPKGATVFGTEKELRKATASWPIARLVEIWNKLPGAAPVKKFTDRKTACARIWKALAPQEATVGAPGAHVAPEAAKMRKKAGKGQKRVTARPGARKAAPARDGSKKAAVLDLMRRKQGATLQEIMRATGWQAHTVRGFVSGTLIRKQGLKVESFRSQERERTYRIPT